MPDLTGNIINLVFGLLSAGLLAFSRNIYKRASENQVFLNKTANIRSKINSQKFIMKQRKTHRIYKCPTCNQKVRVPKGKGKISIHCPKCDTYFIKRS